MKSICFVGLDNYPVLNPTLGSAYIGGESVQQTLLAKAFASMGYDVSMLVKDFGQKDIELIGNIKVIKTFQENTGIPIIKFIHPKITSIVKGLRKADADVYFHSCAGMQTGLVAAFCRIANKKFIFRIASDADCMPGQQLIKYWRDRKVYEYGLKRADLIAAQGKKQVVLLQENYALESLPVNMVVEIPYETADVERDIDVLWVNNLRSLKRPEIYLELAAALPGYRFVMIGGPVPGYEEYYNEIKQKALAVPNLEFLGAVPYSEVNHYFSRAKVFVNTSEIEGFPNSFLQAWIRGVPVVSFFDPDDLISAQGLGVSPEDSIEMAKAVEHFLSDDSFRASVSSVARTYALENYSPQKVAARYIELIDRK